MLMERRKKWCQVLRNKGILGFSRLLSNIPKSGIVIDAVPDNRSDANRVGKSEHQSCELWAIALIRQHVAGNSRQGNAQRCEQWRSEAKAEEFRWPQGPSESSRSNTGGATAKPLRWCKTVSRCLRRRFGESRLSLWVIAGLDKWLSVPLTVRCIGKTEFGLWYGTHGKYSSTRRVFFFLIY